MNVLSLNPEKMGSEANFGCISLGHIFENPEPLIQTGSAQMHGSRLKVIPMLVVLQLGSDRQFLHQAARDQAFPVALKDTRDTF